jgi:phosphoribosyl 1,2-cyclic phosphodiesterase
MRTLGILTDAGCETPHLVAALQGCDALLLECNHDEQMLASGPYPATLKARVGGRLGHLSNQQAAGILAQCVGPALRHVVAAHLSEQNNTSDLALNTLTDALGTQAARLAPLVAATQTEGTDWLNL